MLARDIAKRIRAIFLHDGSAVTIVDFIILLGWPISQFDDAVKAGAVIIAGPASAVPRVSHAQLVEKAREQWSEAEIAEALGDDRPRVLASTPAPAAASSFVCDAVRAVPVDALQLVGAPSPAEILAAGLRPPHREPVPRRRTRRRVVAIAPPPPVPATRRNRADGVREATLSYFEVKYQDLVPVLRLRGRWLARHGFEIGARIYITVAEGRIVITATDPAASAEPARVVALRNVGGGRA